MLLHLQFRLVTERSFGRLDLLGRAVLRVKGTFEHFDQDGDY